MSVETTTELLSPEQIQSITKELVSSEAGVVDSTPQETPAKDVPQEVANAQDKPPAAESQPNTASPQSSQILALARREKALRDSEKARKDWEKEVEQRIRQQIEAEFKERATLDPADFYKGLGIESYNPIAERLVEAQLGDKAPEELRQRTALAQMRAEAARTKKLLDDFRKEQEQRNLESQRQAYVAELDGFLQAAPSTDLPYLKHEFEQDPSAALSAMQTAAGHMIHSTGRIPTAREVAKALETELDQIATRYANISKKTSSQPQTGAHTEDNSGQPTTLTGIQHSTKSAKSSEFDSEEIIKALQSELQPHWQTRKT